MYFQKKAKGQELLDKVCESINLLEKDYFSLSYHDNEENKVRIDTRKGMPFLIYY